MPLDGAFHLTWLSAHFPVFYFFNPLLHCGLWSSWPFLVDCRWPVLFRVSLLLPSRCPDTSFHEKLYLTSWDKADALPCSYLILVLVIVLLIKYKTLRILCFFLCWIFIFLFFALSPNLSLWSHCHVIFISTWWMFIQGLLHSLTLVLSLTTGNVFAPSISGI